MHLDEEGWGELTDVLLETFERVEEIRTRAEQRLRDLGEEGFPATFAMLGFESPPMEFRF